VLIATCTYVQSNHIFIEEQIVSEKLSTSWHSCQDLRDYPENAKLRAQLVARFYWMLARYLRLLASLSLEVFLLLFLDHISRFKSPLHLPKNYSSVSPEKPSCLHLLSPILLPSTLQSSNNLSSEPQTYMFAAMRAAVGIPRTSDILDYIYALPTPEEQEAAMEKVRSIEREAMISQTPQPGLLPLITYLERKQIPKAICTRNFDAPVTHLLEKFLAGQKFHPIITRDFRPPKPDPAGILHIAKEFGLDNRGDSLIMVGDSLDDMTAGYRAGAATVLLVNNVNAHLATHEHTDMCISRLDELVEVLESGFVGQTVAAVEESDARGRAEEVLRDRQGEVNRELQKEGR
jgi:HAD superfamily hydrolase (TIGR01509 family)